MKIFRLSLALALVALLGLAVPAQASTRLSYKEARKAAAVKADAFAGQATWISSVMRTGPRRFEVVAQWQYRVTDPTGCLRCGYDEVTGTSYDTPYTDIVHCRADVIVVKRSARVRALIDGHSCY